MGKEAALPKNIRQIGDIRGREKVCIEDYVMTYIHKKEQQEEKGCLSIFFGEQREAEDSVYVYIRGIFEVPEEIQWEQEKEIFQKEYQKYFGDWEILGCCVIGIYPTERMKALAEWFPESGRLIYHLQEQEETLYWTKEDRYLRLQGYFVFYEQNLKMQEYLTNLFKDNSVEKESLPDRAIKSFREKVKEKGERNRSNFLRMASSFFVITILIIGAIVVNRIEDIRAVRNLSLTEEASVYNIQREGEGTVKNYTAGDLTSYNADTAADTEQYGAAVSTAQYEAAQRAAENTKLAGSDSFWEEVPEDDPTWAEGDDAGDNEADSETENAVDTVAAGDSEANSETENAVDTAAAGGSEANSETGNTDGDSEANSGTANSADVVDADTVGEMDSTATENINRNTTAATEAENAREAVSIRHAQSGYIIKEGDTLAKICNQYYGNLNRLDEICEANGIEDANMILPGQRIVLP